MANLKAGPVSGYRSHGPERRGDASHTSPSRAGGSPMVRVPFSDVKPLGDPQPLSLRAEGRGLGRAIRTGRAVQAARGRRAVSQAIQRNQRQTGWTATAQAAGGPAGPAYGGAAYNGGGGGLANAMSGSSQPRGIAGPSRPGPGVRVGSKPPTSQARSRAGRDRRAANFKARNSGPTVIQGTAEDVTPPPAARGPAVHSFFGRDYVYGPGGRGAFTGKSTAEGKASENTGVPTERPVKSTRKFNPDVS